MITTTDTHTIIYRTLVIVAIAVLVMLLVRHYVLEQKAAWLDTMEQTVQKRDTAARALFENELPTTVREQYAFFLPACPDSQTQERFNHLLGTLGTGLSTRELQFLAAHFDRCVGDFAREQQVRATALHGLLTDMRAYIDAFDRIDDTFAATVQLSDWERVREAEYELAYVQRDLVEAQRALILHRLEGLPVDDAAIVSIMDDIPDLREAIRAAEATRAEARASLDV